MRNSWAHRAVLFAPFVLVAISLSVILWSAWQLLDSPYAGVDWSQSTGIVVKVDTEGPAAGLLQVGDRIVAINSQPISTTGLHITPASGDSVQFQIIRNGVPRAVPVRLSQASVSVVVMRQLPLLVALTFWLISVVILAYKPRGTQSTLFLFFCQAFAWTLAFGAADLLRSSWEPVLFQVLLWWVGPITLHFHLHFPLHLTSTRLRLTQLALYLIAAAGSCLTLTNTLQNRSSTSTMLFAASLLWLALCLFGVVILLVRSYQQATSLEVQRQIRLVTLGGSVTFISFFVLLLLPYALTNQPLVPYQFVFLLLLIIPLTYGYAILSYRLILLDSYVSRVASYVLVITLIISLYLILNVTFLQVLPVDGQQQTANLLLMLVLTTMTIPLYRRLEAIVNYIFYGGSYDYRSAVQLVSQTLDQPLDPQSLAQTLCEGIQKAMQLECVRLLRPDPSGVFVTTGFACEMCMELYEEFRLETNSHIYAYLREHPRPIYTPELENELADVALSEAERQLLGYVHARLWVPLWTSGQILGLCILGPKRGSEIFDVTDLDILQMITRLTCTTLQNIEFIGELRQQAFEREQLHQQVLNAREEERKRVARELHDQIIQSLAGINYHLTDMRSRSNPDMYEHILEVQSNVHQTLDDVRRICADLRPPALDHLGLVSAVRSRLRALEQQGTLRVRLYVDGDPQQQLPEEVALCLFRVMQEGLSNIHKHAEAQMVEVRLRLRPDEVLLTVCDDGKGFHVPSRLGQLLEDHHFGLVGSRERLDFVNGTLTVTSAPDQGTCIQARVPLTLSTALHQEEKEPYHV